MKNASRKPEKKRKLGRPQERRWEAVTEDLRAINFGNWMTVAGN